MNIFGALFIISSLKSVLTEPQNFSFYQNTVRKYDLPNSGSFNNSKYSDTSLFNNQFNKSAGETRQSRNQKTAYTPSHPLQNGLHVSELSNSVGGQFYTPNPYASKKGDIGSTLESPFLYMRRDGYEDETENYGYGHHHEYAPETTTEASDEAEEEEETEEPPTNATTTTTEAPPTTTLAPFTLADVKVPAPFLRIEYMISFTFFGLMYGLGFFVLFQSLCVPAAKIAVYIVYIWLLKLGVVDPVTLEQALEQLPPT